MRHVAFIRGFLSEFVRDAGVVSKVSLVSEKFENPPHGVNDEAKRTHCVAASIRPNRRQGAIYVSKRGLADVITKRLLTHKFLSGNYSALVGHNLCAARTAPLAQRELHRLGATSSGSSKLEVDYGSKIKILWLAKRSEVSGLVLQYPSSVGCL